jgi:2Fe-2S ferredoxin
MAQGLQRMPLLKVVDRDGVEHEVEAKSGLKVMETLRELDYGVAAICGGMCSCATCHVYVDAAALEKLPAPMSDERELLAELSFHKDNSRLSCQIEFTDALAGMRVTIAPDE